MEVQQEKRMMSRWPRVYLSADGGGYFDDAYLALIQPRHL